MKWCLASTAIAVGFVLMILNIAGFFIPIAEHPEAAQKQVHKIRLVRPSYQDSIEALSRLDKSSPPEQLIAEANRIIAARIVHYWPDPGKSDSHTMYSYLENWYLAGLQRAEAWLANMGFTEVDIARDGRRDFRQILAKGVGLCGMAAIALADYLREKDTPTKILALGGHVVVYASVRGRNYILDPDYGVTIADVPAPPERSLSQIVAAYRAAGYWPRKVQKVERKYAASKMRLYDLARFQNGKRRLLARAEIIKWLVPLGLIALGGFLARKPSEVHPRPAPHGPAGILGRAE